MKLNGVGLSQEGLSLSDEHVPLTFYEEAPGATDLDQDTPLGLEPSEVSSDFGFREGLADLRDGLKGMDPRSRLVFIGSGVVSAAVFGYVTFKCGPIPSLRKIITGMPDYMGRENRDWLRHIAGNVVSVVGRSVARPNLYARKSVGVLASVVMAAAMHTAGDATVPTPPEVVAISVSREEQR